MAPAAKYHRRDGAEAMRALLTLPEPPDAVFCFNDLLAVGALRAAAEHGRQVPDDLAVVGFDGSEEGAYTVPTLTTVDPDKAAIADRAVERIGERIAHGAEGAMEAVEIVTPFRLEIRESTVGARPAPASAELIAGGAPALLIGRQPARWNGDRRQQARANGDHRQSAPGNRPFYQGVFHSVEVEVP